MTQTDSTPRTRQKKKSIMLPVVLILIALCVIAAFGLFFWFALSGSLLQAVSPKVDAPEVVLLDDAWTQALVKNNSRAEMSAYIDATLDAAQAVCAEGHAAVALTGRMADGTALFTDGTKTLTRSDALTEADEFLSKFDAVQSLVLAASKRGVAVYLLATDDAGAVLSGADAGALPEWEQKLANKHGLAVITPTAEAAGADVGTYSVIDTDTVLLRADGNPSLLAGAVQNDTTGAVAGVILGSLTLLKADDADVKLYHTFVSGDALPDLAAYQAGKVIADTLTVAYPDADGAIQTGKVFLMGTSDPSQPLTMNGAEVVRYGTKGVWGVLVSLSAGTNSFAFVNGTAAVTRTLNYTSSGGGSGSVTPAPDGTAGEEVIGRKVQITDAIASALTDPGNSDTISETLFRGARAEITNVYTYTNGRKITHAYQLSTGDYIRPATCTFTDAADANFSSVSYTADEGSNCSSFTLPGGTPAVYHNWDDKNTLVLTFLDAKGSGAGTAALNTAIAGDAWFTAATAADSGSNYVLTLHFTDADPLYGWAVNYDTNANTTTIWLKHTPHLSDAPTGPLTGLTVMLDAGHGGDEDGAMGAAGMAAPVEKELNLSAVMAAKYRLEQLGAAVVLTRADDTTVTLGDRVTAMNEQHPDLFISIHHNSIELTNDVNQSTGTEAYWFYDEGEPLADSLIANVCMATGRTNRGSNYGYYYVTRSNICPATLLELGFVTNPAEYEACTDDTTIWAEGGAVADGVYQIIAANG